MPQAEIEIGKLGKQIFPAGAYVYVGSGMGGVTARVRRHLRGSQNKKWHIDYVLEHSADRQAVIFAADDKCMECTLSRRIAALPGTQEIMYGLGSSDCSCATHLYFLSRGMNNAFAVDLPNCSKSVLLKPDSSALDDESQIIWQSYI